MSEHDVHALGCQQAYELVSKDPRAVLIDVRSTMEFLFVGHPTGAIHIPWIDEPDWVVNPHFVTEVRKVLLGGSVCAEEVGGCAPVILICRSGKRSVEAGKALLASGLDEIYHIDEGFEGERDEQHHRGTMGGWRFHGLPWEQC